MSIYIIAEAGVNHNGSLETAKKLVDAAKKAGADCVKFQTFVTEKLVSKDAQRAEYQINNTQNNDTQFQMLKKLELSFDDFCELKRYCDEQKIDFVSTPFDSDSIIFLSKLDMKFWKIPSGEITNLPYLVQIARCGGSVILSTGMSNIDEINEAINVLKENGASEITLLHCTTEYPAPVEDVNLLAINTIKTEFELPVGYSDHTQGIIIPIAAAAMGASVIEKHFTLSRDMEGPDHKASLEPHELAEMVSAIRIVEASRGNGIKAPSKAETMNKAVARKSIVAAARIKKGEILSENNITTKRPGNGISPMKWNQIIGTAAIRDFEEDELIEI